MSKKREKIYKKSCRERYAIDRVKVMTLCNGEVYRNLVCVAELYALSKDDSDSFDVILNELCRTVSYDMTSSEVQF